MLDSYLSQGPASKGPVGLMRGIGALAILALLAACATSVEDNDPAEGGFFKAVQGVSGGQYEERQRRQEEQLARERQLSERLEQRHQQILRDQAQLDREIEDYRQRVARLQSRIAESRQLLLGFEGDNRSLVESLDSAERRLSELNAEVGGGEQIDSGNVDQIMAEIREIELLVTQLTRDLG